MSIKIIRVTIDDLSWPKIKIVVDADGREIERVSLYDTADLNFAPLLTNALGVAVRDIISARKKK